MAGEIGGLPGMPAFNPFGGVGQPGAVPGAPAAGGAAPADGAQGGQPPARNAQQVTQGIDVFDPAKRDEALKNLLATRKPGAEVDTQCSSELFRKIQKELGEFMNRNPRPTGDEVNAEMDRLKKRADTLKPAYKDASAELEQMKAAREKIVEAIKASSD